MGNIVLLDEHTINKIAAGQVVSRPSSIVKELIENSLNAKATSVTVEIRNGGIKYIKVEDNGVGFAADDVEIAFERHATSKIRKEEDLGNITSMGFRGEALASIAAISKVSLTTKNINEDIGTKAYVEIGQVKYIENAAANRGTKIEVFDVFYNVPARFKFLKKDSTEAGYIEDVIIREALANPNVSFKYINNSKVIIQTLGKYDLNSTIYDIFGKEIYDNIVPVKYEINNIKIEGVIGLPNISRSTRMHQFTYVNSRYVKEKLINSAIDKACSEKYAINKFPFCIINLEVLPSHLDVNVHPAKLEVKFENENAIFDIVYHGIRQAIETKNRQDSPFTSIKSLEQKTIDRISNDLRNTGVIKEEVVYPRKDFHINDKINYLNENESQTIYDISKNIVSSDDYIKNSQTAKNTNDAAAGNSNNLETSQEKIANILKEEDNVDNVIKKSESSSKVMENSGKEILYQYVGQVFDTYIIIQINEKMYIIDQHAAHERLLFEQFKESYYSKNSNSQMLLIPTLVELTPKENSIVMENIEMFENAGFIIESFGNNTIKISGVPNVGYDIEYKDMFRDIIDEILGATKTEKEEKEHRFIATLACKAAVKGNMKLDRQEQIELIDKMVKLENPFTCPHGRPTAYEISKYDIERRFLRK